MTQLWRCTDCGEEYLSPIAVREVVCAGVHTTARRRQMEFVAEGESVSPFEREAVSTVRRGSRKEG